MFDKDWFFDLENRIRKMGADSDAQSFDEIRENLSRPRKLSPTEFADMCNYVILAGGFSQKTAKRIHKQIMDSVRENGADFDTLFSMFHNKNKINAICEIWNNKNVLCAEYYGIDNLEDKIKYLSKLPHIGKITANHLARNLGENVVKYDIWIQRLGIVFAKQKQSSECRVQSSDMKSDGAPRLKSAAERHLTICTLHSAHLNQSLTPERSLASRLRFTCSL